MSYFDSFLISFSNQEVPGKQNQSAHSHVSWLFFSPFPSSLPTVYGLSGCNLSQKLTHPIPAGVWQAKSLFRHTSEMLVLAILHYGYAHGDSNFYSLLAFSSSNSNSLKMCGSCCKRSSLLMCKGVNGFYTCSSIWYISKNHLNAFFFIENTNICQSGFKQERKAFIHELFHFLLGLLGFRCLILGTAGF